jgi:hypothetical protein
LFLTFKEHMSISYPLSVSTLLVCLFAFQGASADTVTDQRDRTGQKTTTNPVGSPADGNAANLQGTNVPQAAGLESATVSPGNGQNALGTSTAANAAIAPATVESGVLLAAGPLAIGQALSILGVVAAGGAVLLNNSGTTGTR